MNATFDGAEHKLLNHALSCLSRIGETLSMVCVCEGEKDYVMRLSAVSAGDSAVCAFMLPVGFFQSYQMDVTNDNRRIEVQFPISTMQSVLRNQLNKKLSSCDLQLMENDAECRLAVRLHSSEGTTKTHKLTYEVAPSRFPRTMPSMNEIIAGPLTIQSLLDFFPNKPNGEITMAFTPDICSVRSKVDDGPELATKSNSLETEARLHRDAFVKYDVKQNTVLVIGMKEFRAPVTLADHLQLPLEIRFDQPGDPMILSLRTREMFAQVFVATSNPDENAQQEGSAQEADSRPSAASDMGTARAAHPIDPPSMMQLDNARAADEHHRAGAAAPYDDHEQVASQSMVFSGGITLPGQAALRAGDALPNHPFESTPLAAQKEPQASNVAAETSAEPATQQGGGLFRGLDSDEPTSHDDAMSRPLIRPSRARESETMVADEPAPPPAALELPVHTGASTLTGDGDSLFDASNDATTFEEDREAERENNIDGDTGSDTQNSEDEMPSTQAAAKAKRQRFNPLF